MFIDTRLGSTPQYSFNRPMDWAMRVPHRILKCVGFFARVIKKGLSEDLSYLGTGFVVRVPSSLHGRHYRFIVTAGHVADGLLQGEWLLRMNTTDGNSVGFRSDSNHKWWRHHSDPDGVDVAVTHFPDIRDHPIDLSDLPLEMFLDDALLSYSGVGAGDEVFTVGLFSKMAHQSDRNLPIVRVGNVAMIPEPGVLVPGVDTRRKVLDAEAYLIEARSLGGLSGSPVFVCLTGNAQLKVQWDADRKVGKPGRWFQPGDIFLLGLVNGHWDVFADEKNDPKPGHPTKNDRDKNTKEIVNMGIAVVIPAKKIIEVLSHPEIVAWIAELDRVNKELEGTSTPD
jgi:hypothetical protein